MPPSRNYLVAGILAGLLSLANTVVALWLLPQGSAKLAASGNQPPYPVIVVEVVIGLIGIVAAYGVVRAQRWAVLLTLLLMVVNVLISLPGIPFGPTTFDKVASAVGLLVSGGAIFFLLRRDGRPGRRAETAGATVAAEPLA